MSAQFISNNNKYSIRNTLPLLSLNPVTLHAPGCLISLLVRIMDLRIGTELRVIVLGHGFGNSIDGYARLFHY